MIKDYSELVIEIARRTGVDDVSDKAGQLVGLAENMISKRLRLNEQQTQTTITTDNFGTANLPDDLQEIVSVAVGNCNLERKSINVILHSKQEGFAVLGRKLHSSHHQVDHSLIYFASVPSLEVNNTNFLLENDPEIYLQAVLFQIYSAENDIDKATTTISYLNLLIEEANQVDSAKRHSGTTINFKGIMP